MLDKEEEEEEEDKTFVVFMIGEVSSYNEERNDVCIFHCLVLYRRTMITY